MQTHLLRKVRKFGGIEFIMMWLRPARGCELEFVEGTKSGFRHAVFRQLVSRLESQRNVFDVVDTQGTSVSLPILGGGLGTRLRSSTSFRLIRGPRRSNGTNPE